MQAKETVLYGIPKGETERYMEQLLLTNATPELIERVKELAGKDGFHSFRVATIDLTVRPQCLAPLATFCFCWAWLYRWALGH